MPDEMPDEELELRPWIAANPGFVAPHLPFRICDWSRDYGYFRTAADAQLALDALLAADEPEHAAIYRLAAQAEELAACRQRVEDLAARIDVAADALSNRIESLVRLVNARTEHLV